MAGPQLSKRAHPPSLLKPCEELASQPSDSIDTLAAREDSCFQLFKNYCIRTAIK